MATNPPPDPWCGDDCPYCDCPYCTWPATPWNPTAPAPAPTPTGEESSR